MAEGDGWTIDTLRAHLMAISDERDQRYGQRFTDLETALRAALAASEKAINKAEIATERRFDGVNEFRQTLADQSATFMPRTESEAANNRLAERVDELTNRANMGAGRGAGLNAGWAYLSGAIILLVGVVTVVVLLLNN